MNNSSSKTDQEFDEGPWYKQPWAWFVFAPLIIIMLAWIPFMTIAIKSSDDVVIDNYYKEGRMINMRVDEDRAAKELGLSGDLFFDMLVGEVVLNIRTQQSDYPWPAQIQLFLDHPLEADLDQTVLLDHVINGRYQGDLDTSLVGRWYIRLLPVSPVDAMNGVDMNDADKALGRNSPQAQWRIVSEVNFKEGTHLLFGEQ